MTSTSKTQVSNVDTVGHVTPQAADALCPGVAGDEGSGSGSGSGCTDVCPTDDDADDVTTEAAAVEADRRGPVDGSEPLAAPPPARLVALALFVLALLRQWR